MKNINTTKSLDINQLFKGNNIWRASKVNKAVHKGIPSTFPLLDQYLYGAGWPRDGLTELLIDKPGIGELRLMLPALAKLSQEENRWILWLSPPHIPYAPALTMSGIDISKVLIVKTTDHAKTLWVLEKALASKSCSAVLAWPDQIKRRQIKEKELRRLQLASKEGRCLGILFRHSRAALNASPAELRIQLHAQTALSEHSRIKLKILKRKGGWPSDLLNIEFNDYLNLMTPKFSELRVNNQMDNQVPFDIALINNKDRKTQGRHL